jgi:hypothetical protein
MVMGISNVSFTDIQVAFNRKLYGNWRTLGDCFISSNPIATAEPNSFDSWRKETYSAYWNAMSAAFGSLFVVHISE